MTAGFENKGYHGQTGKVDKVDFAGFYLRNLGTNSLGFITIIVLNLFTPLEFFRMQRAFIFSEGNWKVYFLFFPFVLCLVALLQYRLQSPIRELAGLILRNKEIPPGLAAKGRQRLVNLPITIGLLNLSMWILLPALVVFSIYLFRNAAPKTCLFIFFRTFMIGSIAAGLSFFVMEDYARRALVPLFFPEGRLARVPGTIQVPILRRIKVLYAAGTLNPMIILAGTFAFTAWETHSHKVSVEDFLGDILLFTVILCGIFIVIAFRLNLLVQRSIQRPIQEMLGILDKVKIGDFTQRVRVLSNDEIGILGDAGNAMLAGLAERERIRDTFGKYVTPEIRDQILDGRIPLGGERREATLLFSDLRGFTTYVEENEPEEVITSMRAYFTLMDSAIRKHNGLVLQYVGDAIEAVFGVPLRYHDHEDKAILAALEMRKNLEVFNRDRVRQGKAPFRHGIGIHTGPVLAGNTGSEDRLSYALVGDTVNVASRIAGLTKQLKCDLLVSQETVAGFKNPFKVKNESSHSLKGYSKPVTVYSLGSAS